MKIIKTAYVTTRKYYSNRDIQSLIVQKNKLIKTLKEAKEKIKNDSNDYKSMVDVSYYRLTIRKYIKQIKNLKKNPLEVTKHIKTSIDYVGGNKQCKK